MSPLSGKGCGAIGLPARGIDRHRRDFFLEHLARGHQIGRTLGIAGGDLERAVDHLLDVAAGAQLIFVLHVAAQDASLVGHVLEPVDELVAAALELAFLGIGRCPGKNQHGDAALGDVVDGSGHGLGAAIDVHQDGLGASGDLREALGAGQRDHFIGAGDHLRNGLAGGPGLGQRFDDSRMVAAEIGEQVRDSGIDQGLDQALAPVYMEGWD